MGAILDSISGNEAGQVDKVAMGDHYGDSDHSRVRFSIIMQKNKDRTGVKLGEDNFFFKN